MKGRCAGTLLSILLSASWVGAEPLLHLADTFSGVPFVSARQLALSADGKFLYASDPLAGLTVFRRGDDDRFEVLASYFQRPGGGGYFQGSDNFCLSPDEAHVTVLDDVYDRILVLARDADSGLLTLVQTLAAGEAGVPDFDRPAGQVFSPLGDFLYVGLNNYDAQRFLVFARDPATGTLTLVQELTSPATAISSLLMGMLMSPGGEQLYSLGRPATSTFDRDPATGRLSFAAAIEIFVGAADNLIALGEGAVSPDGSTLYLIGTNGCWPDDCLHAVVVLRRDPASGLPELLEIVPETLHDGLTTLILSAGGRHLYLPYRDDERARISIFSPRPDGGLELSGEFLTRPGSPRSEITALGHDRQRRRRAPLRHRLPIGVDRRLRLGRRHRRPKAPGRDLRLATGAGRSRSRGQPGDEPGRQPPLRRRQEPDELRPRRRRRAGPGRHLRHRRRGRRRLEPRSLPRRRPGLSARQLRSTTSRWASRPPRSPTPAPSRPAASPEVDLRGAFKEPSRSGGRILFPQKGSRRPLDSAEPWFAGEETSKIR